MKILMINVVCGIRSTGRICTDLATALENQGHEVKIAYGREDVPKQFEKYAVRIGRDLDVKFHGIRTRLFDEAGFGSGNATKRFVEWVKIYDPDVIHLHNLHGYYINVKILFEYLKKCQKTIIWTLHDCWSFTGHCVYFDYVNCNKWKKECNHCPQKKEYPTRIGPDFSRRNYYLKKKLFSNIPKLTLVTPSQWLADLVSDSFIKEYPIKVIHNGVDTKIFQSTDSNLRSKYKLGNKKVVLGVASVWDQRKGLECFIKLAEKLDQRQYQIVLVGLSQDQIKILPRQIVGIMRTNSTKELAALYTLAYVFVNPTFEDNYPTTNIEAIACGTPVITFDTGGSTESAEMYGLSVEKGNIDELVSALGQIEGISPKYIDVDSRNSIQKYLKLYGELQE